MKGTWFKLLSLRLVSHKRVPLVNYDQIKSSLGPTESKIISHPMNAVPDLMPKSNVPGSEEAFNLLRLIFYKVPGFIYLHLLFRLPRFYLTRVKRVFEDAEISEQDILRMIVTTAKQWKKGEEKDVSIDTAYIASPTPTWTVTDDTRTQVTQAMLAFKASWNDFIDSLQREWKTTNIISALLLSYVAYNSNISVPH
jgi:hypothetical protein